MMIDFMNMVFHNIFRLKTRDPFYIHSELVIKILQTFALLLCTNAFQINSQFCTCHNSPAVVTCAKLLTDLIIGIKIRVKMTFIRFQSWVYKLCAKWISGLRLWRCSRVVFTECYPKSLVQIMAWHRTGTKPLAGLIMLILLIVPLEFWLKFHRIFFLRVQ